MLDPLHPKVFPLYVRVIRDFVSQYRKYSQFEGVVIKLSNNQAPAYVSIEHGFTPVVVDQFLADTGIELEADREFRQEQEAGGLLEPEEADEVTDDVPDALKIVARDAHTTKDMKDPRMEASVIRKRSIPIWSTSTSGPTVTSRSAYKTGGEPTARPADSVSLPV